MSATLHVDLFSGEAPQGGGRGGRARPRLGAAASHVCGTGCWGCGSARHPATLAGWPTFRQRLPACFCTAGTSLQRCCSLTPPTPSPPPAGYFGGCPVVRVPGFTHPVEDFYLESILQLTGYQAGRDAPLAGHLAPPCFISCILGVLGLRWSGGPVQQGLDVLLCLFTRPCERAGGSGAAGGRAYRRQRSGGRGGRPGCQRAQGCAQADRGGD